MLLKAILKICNCETSKRVVGLGFYVWKKHGFFKRFPYFVGGFIVTAFFDLVGFIGLVFVVIRLIEIIFF